MDEAFDDSSELLERAFGLVIFFHITKKYKPKVLIHQSPNNIQDTHTAAKRLCSTSRSSQPTTAPFQLSFMTIITSTPSSTLALP